MSSDSNKKQQRHKRKESFSILLVSNLGNYSRQFSISLFTVRLLIFLLILIFATFGTVIFLFVREYGSQEKLHRQLEEQAASVKQLEGEKETLNQEKQTLAEENEALKLAAEEKARQEKEQQEAAQKEPEPDPALPSRYPCLSSGLMTAMYAEDHPYVTINTQQDGQIVAAGDGTVITVGSDDTYPLIIEIDHGNGYHTRYLCLAGQEVKVQEGAPIKGGEVLFTIQADNTQLDYQVTFNGETIDPLTAIEAKG